MKAPDDLLTRIVDRAVGLVSPRRAVIRRHFREMERNPEYKETILAMARERGYRAAEDSKNKTPWIGTMQSADVEVVPAAQKITDRTRELGRDDPIGSGALGTFVREMIGTELRGRSRASDENDAAAIEEVWKERRATLTPSDPVPFGQWQRTFASSLLSSGDGIVKRAISKSGEPVWFEMIERERVRTPLFAQPNDPQGRIVDGVEKDRFGRYVAYWILKRHPNDYAPMTVLGPDAKPTVAFGPEDFVRVPFEALKHVKLADRPGQTRGAGHFHAVLQDIRDLDLLMLAALKRTQIAACFALFIESEAAVPDLLDVTAANYGYQLQQGIEPGMIFKLFPGEKVTTVTPNFPTPELETFVIMLARRIGAALGVSWQTILRDWTDSSYSGARTTILGDRQTFMILRHLVREGLLDWMWKTVLEDAKLRGDERLQDVDVDDLAKVQWLGDGQPWVDPLKEAQATQLKLAMKIVTKRDICEEAGGKDWEEQLIQSLIEEKRERELREEMGLPATPIAPAAPVASPAANGQKSPMQGMDGEMPPMDNEEEPAAAPKKVKRGLFGLRRAA